MKLAGVRVVDLSLFVPGPRLTMTMADHGADVIKVEPWPDGDPARQSTYVASSSDAAGSLPNTTPELFRRNNRGKRSIRLNLKAPSGREVLLRLCEKADVLVESFRPGVMQRLGLDYKIIADRAPGIVYCSLTAFGQEGAYRNKPAHDRAAQAMAGALTVTRGESGQPVFSEGVPAAVMAGSLTALNGILMALLRRAKTGRGDYLDIAMVDALLFWNSRSADSGPESAAPGEAAALRSLYATSDSRYIMLGGSEPHFAANLLGKAGRPDLAPLCASPPGPAQAPVKTFLREFIGQRSLADMTQWFAGLDVAWAPVREFHEVLSDPETLARHMSLTDLEGHRHVGSPIQFEAEPAHLQLGTPAIGEHSDAILHELGYADTDIARLRSEGII